MAVPVIGPSDLWVRFTVNKTANVMNDVLRDMLIWFAKFTTISVVLLLTVRYFTKSRRKKLEKPDSGNEDAPT